MGPRLGFLEDGGNFPALDIFFLKQPKKPELLPTQSWGELQVRAKLQNPDRMRFHFLCLLLVS